MICYYVDISEMYGGRRLEKLCQKYSLETGGHEKPQPPPPICKTNTLFLVIHGGNNYLLHLTLKC